MIMCTRYKNVSLSHSDYIKKFMSIYIDERAECYYYPLLKELLNSVCSEFEKVVRVDDNKQKSSIHAREIYATEGGLQDLIIVPVEYTYENPTRPFVTIESKMPDMEIVDGSIVKYNKLKPTNRSGEIRFQLKKQFKKTNYIIYTDCITWNLLYNNGQNVECIEISLLNPKEDKWDWTTFHGNFSSAKNFLNKEINASTKWEFLIKHLLEFINLSKCNEKIC